MRYIIRKVLTLIITLFMVSLLAFLAFQVIPGSPASSMLGTNATPEKIAALEAEMGLDDPVLVRYARWAGDFIQGDWGQSYSYDMPVKDMVMEKLPATAALVLLAFANVFFVIYDGAVRNITLAYRNWFRPKILKKAR